MALVPEAIYTIIEEEEVPRLSLFAVNELGVDRAEAHGLICQAIREVLQGQHHHHFKRHVSLFRCLCGVLTDVLASQREQEQGEAGRVS